MRVLIILLLFVWMAEQAGGWTNFVLLMTTGVIATLIF